MSSPITRYVMVSGEVSISKRICVRKNYVHLACHIAASTPGSGYSEELPAL
jgi:hypothetical protein